MKRRKFITLLTGAAAVWPVVVWGQQTGRMRRIGMLSPLSANDPIAKARLAAFRDELSKLGWADGRDVKIDIRWSAGIEAETRRHAAELVALAPDVIFATAGAAMPALLQVTRTVPIVFVQVIDPVGAGFVDSLARPGGNTTGFTTFEYGTSGKWLELLKQLVPRVMRVAVLRDAANPAGIGQFAAMQGIAPSLNVELRPIDVRDASEIERALMAFANAGGGGVVVTASALAIVHRDLIFRITTQHRLPAIYWDRALVTAGGLISYGPDLLDQNRRAAGYVDRILKGEKTIDLPVQAATKYETVINLKTAKSIGLEVPLPLQQRADEVIE